MTIIIIVAVIRNTINIQDNAAMMILITFDECLGFALPFVSHPSSSDLSLQSIVPLLHLALSGTQLPVSLHLNFSLHGMIMGNI